MAAVLRWVVDAQLYYPAVEGTDPLQLGGRQAHLGEACVQRLDHVLSRHRARRCVRVLRHDQGQPWGESGYTYGITPAYPRRLRMILIVFRPSFQCAA